jgi:predicted transcriptional regulator
MTYSDCGTRRRHYRIQSTVKETYMYLGIMNGWKETPAQYTKHLAECGTEYETTICYMEYPEEGGCIKRQRQEMRKRYDLTSKRSGTYSVKTEEACNECGCSWESWT